MLSILMLSLLWGCSAGQEAGSPNAPPPAHQQEDPLVADQETREAEAQEEAEPPPPPLQAARLLIRDLDIHRAARFVGASMRDNTMVLGGTMQPLSLELEDVSTDRAFETLATRASLQARRIKGVMVIGPDDVTARLADFPYGSTGPLIDLNFCLVVAEEYTRLLADVCRLERNGAILGTVTIVARAVGARNALELLLGAGGITAQLGESRLVIPQSATLAAIDGWPPPRELETCLDSPAPRTHARAWCVPIGELTVKAIMLSEEAEPQALVTRSSPGPGPNWGELVRRGDLIGHGRETADGSMRFWRIDDIDEQGLHILLDPVQDEASGEVRLLALGASEERTP